MVASSLITATTRASGHRVSSTTLNRCSTGHSSGIACFMLDAGYDIITVDIAAVGSRFIVDSRLH